MLRPRLSLANLSMGLTPFLGDPALDLDFTRGVLPNGVSFSRAGGCGVVNSSGLYEWLPADVPSFDYDPVSLVCKGLRLSASKQNLYTYSQDFAQPVWGKPNATQTPGASMAPNGLMQMTRITETVDASSATHSLYRNMGGIGVSGQYYADSAVVRMGTSPKIQFQLYGTAFSSSARGITIDQNGLVTVIGALFAHRAVNLGGGLWYLSIVAQASANGEIWSYLTIHDGTTNWYQGTGTYYFDVWGRQLENSTFSGPYIPTTTSALVTASDICTMAGANVSRWFNPHEGAFVVEVLREPLSKAGFIVCPARSVAGWGPRHQIVISSANRLEYAVVDDTESVIVPGLGNTVAGSGPHKLAAAYKAADFAASVNGGTILTGASGTPPTGLDILYIGADETGTNVLDGHIRRIQYYRRRLPNARTQELAVVA